MKFLKCLPRRRTFLEEMAYTLLILPDITPCGMQEGTRNLNNDQLNVTNTSAVARVI